MQRSLVFFKDYFLFSVYYVFDLKYPKVYSQVLGILQTYVLTSVPYPGKKSSKYVKFATLLKTELEKQDNTAL